MANPPDFHQLAKATPSSSSAAHPPTYATPSCLRRAARRGSRRDLCPLIRLLSRAIDDGNRSKITASRYEHGLADEEERTQQQKS